MSGKPEGMSDDEWEAFLAHTHDDEERAIEIALTDDGQERFIAPWTDGVTEALNRWQTCRWVHPFTCPNRDRDHWEYGGDVGELVATNEGWVCRDCDYTQGWAHAFMLTTPGDPFAQFPTTARRCEWPDGCAVEVYPDAALCETHLLGLIDLDRKPSPAVLARARELAEQYGERGLLHIPDVLPPVDREKSEAALQAMVDQAETEGWYDDDAMNGFGPPRH